MAQLTINTTQNVKLNFEIASLFSRGLAFLIDTIFKLLYGLLIVYLLKELLAQYVIRLDLWGEYALWILFLLPVFFYSLIFESAMQGTTPGKKLMKIKVIKIDGYEATFIDYLIRWIFRLVDVLIGGGVIGLLVIMLGSKGQRLGDVVAGTAVISLKETHRLASTIYQELETEYIPVYPQVLQLSDNDIRIIKQVIQDFRTTENYKLLDQLAVKIEQTLGVKRKTDSQLDFIYTVLKDYNYMSLQL